MQRLLIFCLLMWIPLFSDAACTGALCRCSLSTTGLTFGSFDPIEQSPDDSTGIITVTCSVPEGKMSASYQIQLTAGSSNNFTTRTMKSNDNVLNYNLYTDGSMSSVWGNNTGNSQAINDSYNTSTPSITKNYTVYGRIFSPQSVAAGSYHDLITVVLVY